MENLNNLDTSEMLSEQDYKDMQDIRDIKRRVLSFVDVAILVDYITGLIEKSPYLTFKNERSKKYIDKRRPIFYVKIDREAAVNSKEYSVRNKKFTSKDEEVKYYSNIVFMEVITHVTRYITESLKCNPELEDYIAEKDIFKNVGIENRKTILNNTAVLSTMFGIRFSQDDSTVITLEMLI